MSFIVPGMDDLRTLYDRFQAEGTRILRTVTHGISVSIHFLDPEDNVGEVYYKTGYNVRQGFSRSPFNMCVVVATPNLDTVSQRNCRQEPDTRMTVMCRRFSCSSSNIDVERAGL